MIDDEHNLTKAEVCLYLLSPDIADIVGSATDAFTVLGNRLLPYSESGIRAVLNQNFRVAEE